MRIKLICTLLIVSVFILVPACQYDEADKADDSDAQSVEQVEESYQDESAPPEFDENGNPTGDYAQYLWEQQQMEEAKNSLVEDAMGKQYEEDLEPHIFPLD